MDEQRLYEKLNEIDVLRSELKSWREITLEHRQNLLNLISALKEMQEKILNRFDLFEKHCASLEPLRQDVRLHLAETKENKSFLRDKRFQLIIGMTIAAWGAMFAFVNNIISYKINREAKIEERRIDKYVNENYRPYKPN